MTIDVIEAINGTSERQRSAFDERLHEKTDEGQGKTTILTKEKEQMKAMKKTKTKKKAEKDGHLAGHSVLPGEQGEGYHDEAGGRSRFLALLQLHHCRWECKRIHCLIESNFHDRHTQKCHRVDQNTNVDMGCEFHSHLRGRTQVTRKREREREMERKREREMERKRNR